MYPLRLVGISASYAGSGERTRQLDGIDLQVAPGQVVAVLGPNGAGKSTLLRVAAGVLRPMSGRVELVGQPLSELDRRALAQRLSWVPQHEEAAAGFTAREVVAMGRAPYQGAWLRSRAQDEEVVEETLQACGLRDLANRLLTSLSGGEQKRVHIARALAQRAPVLLLDEASAHLDIRHAVELHGLLRAQVLARQIACLAVMHDLNAAARFADRIVLLDAGRIVAEGSVEAVMTEARLGAVFGTAIHVATAGPDGRPTFLAVGPQATD